MRMNPLPQQTTPFFWLVKGADLRGSLANKSWLKVADIAALVGQYPRAIEKYEAVAKQSLNSNLTKWSVKDYFFKAGACYLANKVNNSMA